jgi:hypothetical protein
MKLSKDLALLSSVQIVAARRFSERTEYEILESGTYKDIKDEPCGGTAAKKCACASESK